MSSRSPTNFECLSRSAAVHSKNSICATVSGRSQTHSFIFSVIARIREKREEFEARLSLKPVMSLRSKIINLRRVPAGGGVGYNSTFVAKRPSCIGVLAAGYADGVHRSLGNRGSVLVRGKLAPIVGIVSMDVTMIDVTDVEDVEIGDVATIYGTDGAHRHMASVVARSVGTVTSDLLCAVSARVPRVYLR